MKKIVGVLPIVILVIGLLTLSAGVFMFVQGSSAESKIEEEMAPLTLDQLDSTYEGIKSAQKSLAVVEEPKIKTGEDSTGMYVYLTGQKLALIGLKTNLGMSSLMKLLGGMFALTGLTLLLVGLTLFANVKRLKSLGAVVT